MFEQHHVQVYNWVWFFLQHNSFRRKKEKTYSRSHRLRSHIECALEICLGSKPDNKSNDRNADTKYRYASFVCITRSNVRYRWKLKTIFRRSVPVSCDCSFMAFMLKCYHETEVFSWKGYRCICNWFTCGSHILWIFSCLRCSIGHAT